MLQDFLKKRIGDKRILRLISKRLKTGYIEDGKRIRQEVGTPQGSVISPLLANIYLPLCAGHMGILVAQNKDKRVFFSPDPVSQKKTISDEPINWNKNPKMGTGKLTGELTLNAK
jgi:hypothetical protein